MADLQVVWRAVHLAAAQAALDEQGIVELRRWARGRLTRMPFAVFDTAKAGIPMKSSFTTAIGIAARRIAAGEPADGKET